MSEKRFLGVTIQPMYFQSEGVDTVLDSLSDAGVTALATAPSVYEEIDELPGEDEAGSGEELARREPPVDAGAGSVRVVERLLWGKEEVLINPSPAAAPNMEFYAGLKYQPQPATRFTETDGHLIDDVIDGAHARGMKVYFQVSAVQVPAAHDDDMPRLPNGESPRHRMVNTAAIASDDIRGYVCARIGDLLTSFPEIDGLKHDWPEHPPYRLGDAFLDFSANAKKVAVRLGIDFEAMRSSADRLYRRLGNLTNDDLGSLTRAEGLPYLLSRALSADHGLAQVLKFKAALTTMYIREMREAMDAVPGGIGKGKELAPNAFPPPLSLLSGMDFGEVAEYADSICTKLYTMHWPVMVRFYAEEILEHNSHDLDHGLLVRALSMIFDFEDSDHGATLDDYQYPAPDETHRAGSDAQIRKIGQAVAAAGGKADIHPGVHGYGPLEDFTNRLNLAWGADCPGIWVNRYCYLGPQKLEAMKQLGNGS
jgi:hypothetical protein